MGNEIRGLEPQEVWNKFADLNAVPRPSKNEGRVISFMLDFGTALGLETFADPVGNVIIRKPPTAGMEGRKTVTLQAHLDMVHQKNSDTRFDFMTMGIPMYVEGDWVKARGTTLGADNGIGVAAIMALLQSANIPHPPLEALFTIDEETGMTGAMGLQAGVLKGEILLNLDTEEDDEIDIGCAGGIDVSAYSTYTTHNTHADYEGYQIKVSGLKGGHSGMDIHKGLGNANKIMNRLLYHCVFLFDANICEVNGGGLRNAIPRESVSTIEVYPANDSFRHEFQNWATAIKNELATTEPNLAIELNAVERPSFAMENANAKAFLRALYAAHNGVYAMSASFPDLVETSNNIARVELNNGQLTIGCLARSSVNSAKMDLANALRSTFELANYEVVFSGEYPGWQPRPDSAILAILKQKYESMFGEKPNVVACHAGLECGILGRNYPNMEMISFGPTIRGAHSPDERVSIKSVRKFWAFLQEVLKDIPKKAIN